jgi:hypothetical protein
MAPARIYLQEDKLFGNPRFTSYDPRQVVLHELSHGQADLNLRNMGREDLQRDYTYGDLEVAVNDHGVPNLGLRPDWQEASTYKWGDIGRGLLAADHNVSRYAATTPAEYVAEISAGLMLGQRYMPATLGWYEYFGGEKRKAVQ